MHFELTGLFNLLAALLLAPLLPGLINRTKAVVAGRQGPPVLQLYYDLDKLLRKGAVYSRTIGVTLLLAPAGVPVVLGLVLLLLPGVTTTAMLAFNGDLILALYLLALARFMTVLAALTPFCGEKMFHPLWDYCYPRFFSGRFNLGGQMLKLHPLRPDWPQIAPYNMFNFGQLFGLESCGRGKRLLARTSRRSSLPCLRARHASDSHPPVTNRLRPAYFEKYAVAFCGRKIGRAHV